MAASTGFLSKPIPTWGEAFVAVACTTIMNGHKWYNAFTKRMEFRAKQAERAADLAKRLAVKQAKASKPKGKVSATAPSGSR